MNGNNNLVVHHQQCSQVCFVVHHQQCSQVC